MPWLSSPLLESALGRPRVLVVLLLLLQVGNYYHLADAARLFSNDFCNTVLQVPSLVTGTTKCGVRIDLDSSYAAAPGAIRVGFSINEVLPILTVVQVKLPDLASPFAFNTGGDSSAVGLITAGGDEQQVPLHGMGSPGFAYQTVAGGLLATVTMGEIRQPTLADSEAGFQFNITNVRNPYAGNATGNATVRLLMSNGSIWYEENVHLSVIVPGRLTPDRAKFAPTKGSAGIEVDIDVQLKPWGVLPQDGQIVISLPVGFRFRAGSTVAINQLNFGNNHAIYVSGSSEAGRNITIKPAPSLGSTLSDLEPHRPNSDLFFSFTLTSIRTPFSGVSGTFKIQTFTGEGAPIDVGDEIPGVQVDKGSLRDVTVTSSDNAARKQTQITLTFGTSGTVPADGKILFQLPFGYLLLAPTLLAYTNLGQTGIPSLSVSGQTLIIQLGGGGGAVGEGGAALALDTTDGVSLTFGGIVNPGAGSTDEFVLRTTFLNQRLVIDEAQVLGTLYIPPHPPVML
jgi:hypothetical protein